MPEFYGSNITRGIKYWIAFGILLLPLCLFSQSTINNCNTATYYTKITSDIGKKITLQQLQVLPVGDIIFAGNSISTNNQQSGLIIKMSQSGDMLAKHEFTINNQAITVYDCKAFLTGKFIVVGRINDGTNNFFTAYFNNDLTLGWSKKFALSSLTTKVTVHLYDTAKIAIAAQVSNNVVCTAMDTLGNVQWSNQIAISGITELSGLSRANFYEMGLVTNCIKNGKGRIEVDMINTQTGQVTASNLIDDGTKEEHSLGIAYFSGRQKILGVIQNQDGSYQIERNIHYNSSKVETKHTYTLPGTFDFKISGAMDNSGDVIGIALPKDRKCILIEHLTDYNTYPERIKSYTIDSGCIIKGINKTKDRGYILALNTIDSSSIIIIKTDSSGVLAGCGSIDLSNNFVEKNNIPNETYPKGVSINSPINTSNTLTTKIPVSLNSQFICRQNYCPQAPFEDSCMNSFFKTYRTSSFSEAFGAHCILRNDRHLVVTSRADRNFGETNIWNYAIKIFSENGTYIKGIYLDINNAPPSTFSLHKMTDSTVMVLSYFLKNGIYCFNFTLLSDDLNIIWTKSVETFADYNFFYSGVYLNDLHRDKEGNYYMLGGRMGFAPILSAILVFKMDSQGNPLWLKTYSTNISNNYIGSASITSSNSSVIIVAEGSPQNVNIRLNKQTGAFENCFAYQSTAEGSVFSRYLSFENNRILYAGTTPKSDFFMGVFDTTGKPLKLKSINKSSIPRAACFKNGILYSTYQFYDGTTSKDVLLKVDTGLNIIFYGEYPVLKYSIPNSLVVGSTGAMYQIGYFSGQPSSYSYLYPYLKKFDVDGKLGSCLLPEKKLPEIIDIPPSFTVQSTTEFFKTFTPIPIVATSTIDTNVLAIGSILCGNKVNCSTINISGNKQVCALNKTQKLVFVKNNGCTVVPQLEFDANLVTLVALYPDSAIVTYKKSGTTTIRAILNSGCNLYSDSIIVNVENTPVLDLGIDKDLCVGNTLPLNAGKGYASYLWQDGSTDTLFTVVKPGTYFIKVTDYCSNILTDTVLITQAPPIAFKALIDRVKCNSDTIQFIPDTGFVKYSWSPNYNISLISSSSIVVNPFIDTTYYLRAEKLNGCYINDTVLIKVFHSPAINLGNDTAFCQGSFITLDAGNAFNKYSWSNGSTSQQIIANVFGKYSVKATTSDGCSSFDTLSINNVYNNPIVNLPNIDEICDNSKLILDAGSFSAYKWQDNSTSRYFSISTVGKYFVQVADVNNCLGSDTVVIKKLLSAPNNFLPKDSTICSYDFINIIPLPNFNSYLWNTNAVTSTIRVGNTGKYWLKVIDKNGCVGTDTIQIITKECRVGIYIPSAFTPNHDGKNDIFKPIAFGPISDYLFTIYNRFGEIIFSSVDVNRGWDGKFKSIMQDNNTFVWNCIYRLNGGELTMQKGTVTLIR